MEKKRIDYMDGFTIDEDGNMKPVFKTKNVILDCTTRFHNCMYLLVGLSPCARNLMDYLAEVMDKDNIVRNDRYLRERFVKFIEEITKTERITYKDSTVKEAFGLLASRGLLIAKSKGIYKVNPLFYHNGKEEERINDIIIELKISSEETNFKVMRVR